MSPHERELDIWVRCATEYALCGPVAIEDILRQLIDQYGHEVIRLVISRVPQLPGRYRVELLHRAKDRPDDTALSRVFTLPLWLPNTKTWEQTLEFIQQRQASMPLHLRGQEHNADEKLTLEIIDKVKKVTRYDVEPGDLWVHRKTPHAFLGFLTRRGEIAFRKYTDTLSKEGKLCDVTDSKSCSPPSSV